MEHLDADDADGVRVARRRRRAHRRDDVPHVPRPPRAPRLAGHRADAHRRRDALPPPDPRARSELFYADVYASRKTPLQEPARHAGHPRPALGLRRRVPRRARPLRLPAAVAARQRHALAQVRARTRRSRRSTTPTARSSASCTPPAGPSTFLDEHAVIVVADHSHALGRGSTSTSSTRFGDFDVTGPGRRDARRRARSPSARRSARRWSTSSCPRRATQLLPRLLEHAARRPTASTSSCTARTPSASSRSARGDAVVRARARRCATRAAASGSCAATSSVLDAADRGRRLRAATRTPTRSRACGRRSSARPRATSCSPRRPATSSLDWGGADHVGGGSHGSLHRSDSLGALVIDRASTIAGADDAVVDPRRRRAGARHFQLPSRRMSGPTTSPRRCRVRAWADGMRRPVANWLQLVRFGARRRERLRRQPRRLHAARPRRGRRTTASPRLGAFLVAVANNFLLEPPLDVPRPRRARAASRPRASSPSASSPSPSTCSILELLVAGLGRAEVPAQAVGHRRRHAAELPRQQALELRAVRRAAALAAAASCSCWPLAGRRRRAGAQAPPSRSTRCPTLRERTGREVLRDRRPRGEEVRDERAKFRGPTREVFTEGRRPLAGQLLHDSRRAAQGDRAGPHRRPHRRGHRGVDRLRRSRGRWPAATTARSAARSTRRTSGSRCCVLFVVPFVDPRRPFRWLHLDLLVLLARSARRCAFFNDGEHRRRRCRSSTRCSPTCSRACSWIGLRARPDGDRPPLRCSSRRRGWRSGSSSSSASASG